jgi:hypothetical protein
MDSTPTALDYARLRSVAERVTAGAAPGRRLVRGEVVVAGHAPAPIGARSALVTLVAVAALAVLGHRVEAGQATARMARGARRR